MTRKNNQDILAFFATGKLGRLVMRSLLEKNYNVTIFSRNNNPDELSILENLGANIYLSNFDNINKLDNLIKENCNIYIGNIYELEICKKIIELIKKSEKKINKIIFISGSNPKTISTGFQILEKFEEHIINELNKSIIIKPTMIFGLNDDKNIQKICKFLKRFPIFPIIGNGETLYQPIHYLDLKNTIINIIKKENITVKKIYIGGKDTFEFQKIIKIIKQKINSKSLIIKFPQKLIYLIAKIITVVFRINLPLEKIASSHINRIVDNSDAIKSFDHSPKSFDERLEESLIKYYDI